MRRTRSVVCAMLAAVLLAAGCGSDDTSPEPEHSQTPDMAESATDGDLGLDTATEPDSAQRADQQGAGAAAEAGAGGEAASAAVPRLGDRFAWCADIRAIWERQVQAQAQADAAEAAYQTALSAYESATDELDKAEASQNAEAALRRYENLESDLQDAAAAAADMLSSGPSGADETQRIALERARAAYSASADPSVQELLSMTPSRDPLQPAPYSEDEAAIELLDFDEASAVIGRYQSEVEDLIEPISSAHQAMLDGQSAIDAAKQPDEAVIGLRHLLDAIAELKELNRRLRAALDGASDAQKGHEEYEREAQLAGEITQDEFRANRDFVRTHLAIVYMIAEPALDQAGQFADVVRAAEVDVPAKAGFFAVTDTDAMAAFWASLSESCQP